MSAYRDEGEDFVEDDDPVDETSFRRIDEHQLLQLLNTIRVLADDVQFGVEWPKGDGKRLELTGFDLLRKARGVGREVIDATGFPRSTRPAAGHGVGSHADPVMTTATALPSTLMRLAAVDLVEGVETAMEQLHKAVEAMLQVASPPRVVQPLPPPQCRSHERIGEWAPVAHSGRCTWCYRWWLAHDDDPPIEILKLYDSGVRITAQVVAQHMPRAQRRKNQNSRR